MIEIRRRLRLLSAAWILFQVTSLSTLVPRACCMAHQAKPADCHEQASVEDDVAAQAKATAPMHHGHGQMDQQQTAPTNSMPAHECALRGTCGGPAAALLALLSTDGILTDSIASLTDFPFTGQTLPATDQLVRQFESPDAPPPRA
jgi:hypothetical protein